MRLFAGKSGLLSEPFQTFYFQEKGKTDGLTTLLLLTTFSLIAVANLVAVELMSPSKAEMAISIIMPIISISSSIILKFGKGKIPEIFGSIAILCLQILIVLQFSETYLRKISKNIERDFPANEIKVWLCILLYFAEKSLVFRLMSVFFQLLITAVKDETYIRPWVFLDYILVAFVLCILETQKMRIFLNFYPLSKQLRFFFFLINKILPFGYLILGLEEKKGLKSLDLMGYNDSLKRIFEFEEKESNVPERLLQIFQNSFLNRNKKTMSCMSIEEKRQKSILMFAKEKLEALVKKKKDQEEIRILEEIIQQEVVYQEGKAKAIDIVILQANISTKPCIFMVINDISDRVLNYKLTNLDRFKDGFLRSMSHNLKTPLNSITGLVSLAHNLVLNTEVIRYLNNITINSEILLYEINNILDYANYRKNSLQAHIKDFSISSLLNEIFTLFELSVFEKKIHLSRKIKLDPDQTILSSDLERLKQILFNLLHNSVKFTFEGKISVTVAKPSDLAVSAELLKFTIKDTGIGITSDDQQKLFKLWGSLNDEFMETPQEISNSRKGAGLGLTISKHLIGLLGPEEKIYFQSRPGKGSTFFFYIYQNLNNHQIINFNKKKIEVIPSYDSSNISLNRMTINSQFMLNSLQKADTMGFANFSSYVTHTLKSPKRTSMVNSFSKSFRPASPSNFSPQSMKNSIPEVFNEADCVINQVYRRAQQLTKEKSEVNLTTNPLVERSSFSFKINLITIDNRSPTKELLTNPGEPQPDQKKVLIVDDTPFNLLVLEKFIQDIDKKALLFKAFNGKEAVNLFQQMKEPSKSAFDLIFMDCNMPVMDGYEASLEIKRIIQEEGLTYTPILAVTAYSGKEEENKCLKNGMDGYLGKPINKEKFQEFYLRWAVKKIDQQTNDNYFL